MMHLKHSPLLSASLIVSLSSSLAACGEGDDAGGSDTFSSATATTTTTETGDSAADGSEAGTADSGTDASGTDTSGTDSSGTDTTGTDTSGTDGSGTDTSGTDTSGTDTSGTDTSSTTGDGDCSMDPGWGPLQMGSQVKHITGTNHDGTMWDMGDWCGTKIGLDISAVWCGPCQMVAACLSGDDGQCGQIFGGSYGPDLRGRIDSDAIKWVTFLTQNDGGSASAVSDAAAWDASYPNENIPVIIPDEHGMVESFSPKFFPSIHALDEGMRFAAIDDGQTWNQLDFLLQ